MWCSPTILVLASIIDLLPIGMAIACDLDVCTEDFSAAVTRLMPGASKEYCHAIEGYGTCLEGLVDGCERNIEYAALTTLVKQQLVGFHCSDFLSSSVAKVRNGKHSSPITIRASCNDMEPTRIKDYQFCQVFGLGHVSTFSGIQFTCRAMGAWPLIDNEHLTVQISNRLSRNLATTSVSQITLIVKSTDNCAKQFIYVARADFDLPSFYTDGTPLPSFNTSMHKSERYLFLKHASILIWRRRRRLGISIALERGADGGQHWCSSGCQPRQQIAITSVIEAPSRYLKCYDRASEEDRRRRSVLECTLLPLLPAAYSQACLFDALVHSDHHTIEGEEEQNDLDARTAVGHVGSIQPSELSHSIRANELDWRCPSGGATGVRRPSISPISFVALLFCLCSST